MKAHLHSLKSLCLGLLAQVAVAAVAGCAAHALSGPDLAPGPKAAPVTTDAVDSRTQPSRPEGADMVASPTVFVVEEEICIWKQGHWVSERSECLALSPAPHAGLAAR
jgi:hypothetical protein